MKKKCMIFQVTNEIEFEKTWILLRGNNLVRKK